MLEPDWVCLDDIENLVAQIDIDRGRQTEQDTTDTSTAVIHLNDTEGLFDSGNALSPFYGKIDGIQVALQLYNPVADVWVPQFRGHITNWGYDLHPSQVVSNIQVECEDLFAMLEATKLYPGLAGHPGGPDGVVFYEDATFQLRLTKLMQDAGLDPDMYSIFTGNVIVQETNYDPDDSLLVAVRDTVDAEFPTVANVYTDKRGRVCAHGRLARFDPDTTMIGTDWEFTRWKAGDLAAIIADGPRAQIRPQFSLSRDVRKILNTAISYPMGILEADIPGQVSYDATSRDRYGPKPWEARDLIVEEGTTTGLTANQETKLFADYIIANYKDPKLRVEALTLRSMNPDDSRAAATWAMLCGQDINDIVELYAGYPGGTGVDENFYIEGSSMTIKPAGAGAGPDDVELSLNVSSAQYYLDDVGLFG